MWLGQQNVQVCWTSSVGIQVRFISRSCQKWLICSSGLSPFSRDCADLSVPVCVQKIGCNEETDSSGLWVFRLCCLQGPC